MEDFLSDECVFVYLRTRSEPLRDPDRLRELSLDLSKNNRMTKFLLYKERVSAAANLHQQRKGISANLHWPLYQLKACFVESSRRSMMNF